MSRRATVIGFAVVLVLGLSLGFNAGLLFTHHFGRPAGPPRGFAGRPGPPFAGPRGGAPGLPPLDHLVRVLDLDDGQRERIRAHIDATRPRMRAVHDSLRAAIESELTPGQLARWRELQPRRRMSPGQGDGPWDRPEPADPGPEGGNR